MFVNGFLCFLIQGCDDGVHLLVDFGCLVLLDKLECAISGNIERLVGAPNFLEETAIFFADYKGLVLL